MSITPRAYQQFQQEFGQLLAKFGIGTYFFGVVTHDEEGDVSDLPILFNVVGNREKNISGLRLGSIFVENLLGGLVRMLMRVNGLTLHQAVGALQESLKVAAHEIQQEQEAFLKKAQEPGD